MRFTSRCRGLLGVMLVGGLFVGAGGVAAAGEPDPSTYWNVKDLRPGMTGKGRTVMRGTTLEDFDAEILGVMKDVNPGRDMVLCRLKGCNLEHAGIIQGMSGSPIYIDGKLLGAVAYAWEFAKDPIAGVTPFSQMIQYVRSNDRRIAAESKDRAKGGPFAASTVRFTPVDRGAGRRRAGAGDLDAAGPGVGWGDGRDDADRDPAGGLGIQPAGPGRAGRSPAADRHGADGRRGGARAGHPRGGQPPAGPGGSAEHRAGTGRLRPVGHRHGHPRRGQPRLRLRPSDDEPGGLRAADDDRLHPHRVPAGQRQHEDGLAALDRRRDRHRREHQRRRPGRPPARPAADERPGQDRAICRCPHLSRPGRPRAGADADLDHVRIDQRHRHRGQPPRGADGAA